MPTTLIFMYTYICGSDSKASAYNVGDPGSIPGSGRSPGEGNGNPLHYSCRENPVDGEAWEATVHWVAKSRPLLSDFLQFHFQPGKEGKDRPLNSLELFNTVAIFSKILFLKALRI